MAAALIMRCTNQGGYREALGFPSQGETRLATITQGGAAAATSPADPRKGFMRWIAAALRESRMQEAEREIGRYRHAMPEEQDRGAVPLDRPTEDALPFVH